METVEYDAMHAQEKDFWWYRALHEITLARLTNLIGLKSGRLLDAGCGTGGLLNQIHHCLPGVTLTGLEYHSAGIQHLKALNNISVINGNLNATPFADQCFDVITMNDVLYHNNIHPNECLTECFRILKPQGHLLINVAAYNWMQSTHDKQVHTRERYTTSKLRQQLRSTGFIIRRSGYWNSLLFPIMAVHRLTAGQVKETSDVGSLPDWQDKFFYRVIRCEQGLQQHGINIPFGGSAWAWVSKP